MNINIVKNLKITKNCVRVFKVEIDEDLKQYLANKYELAYRFKACGEIINDFSLVNEIRFFFLTRYSYIKEGILFLKLNRERTCKYLQKINSSLVSKSIKNNETLSVKLTV